MLSDSVRGREGPSFTMGARMQIMPPACQRKDEVDQGSSTSSNFNNFFLLSFSPITCSTGILGKHFTHTCLETPISNDCPSSRQPYRCRYVRRVTVFGRQGGKNMDTVEDLETMVYAEEPTKLLLR